MEQAIAVLEDATCRTPSSQLLQLLGNVEMKACRWSDAVASFNRCLAAAVCVCRIFSC